MGPTGDTMMRLSVEDHGLRVILDPHDGACHGDHNIAIVGFPVLNDALTAPAIDQVHVTLSWGASAVLSMRGTREFRDAMNIALDIADKMQAAGLVTEDACMEILRQHMMKRA